MSRSIIAELVIHLKSVPPIYIPPAKLPLRRVTPSIQHQAPHHPSLQLFHPTVIMASTAPPTAPRQNYPANQTLYIQNLNDKIRKEDLRISLYTLFSTYGCVLDVNALKSMKHRGQAHVAFRDVVSATQAMRALQGVNVYGKDMVGFFPFVFFTLS